MSFATYTRYELLRTFRNRRFVILALGFPLVLYLLIATPNRHEHDLGGSGLSAPLYFMVGLITFGAMNAMLSTGSRIAAKVLTGYAMALLTIGMLYAAGFALGVRLPAHEWLQMTWLILVGLVPFAALGILMGHLLTADSIGPALGGITALFAFLGGAWFPIASHGAMHAIAQSLPSYWLVQAAHVGVGGSAWGAHGWAVLAAWSVGATILARRAYVRNTQKV
jgi:ABC-2 type transport system permease protein